MAEERGGGLVSYGTVTASDSSLTSNRSRWNGGGLYAFLADVTWTAGSISNNIADTKGGGIYFDGNNNHTMTLAGVEITNNEGVSKGGGLYVEDAFVAMTACTLTGNKSNLGTALCFKPKSYATYSFNGTSDGTFAADPF